MYRLAGCTNKVVIYKEKIMFGIVSFVVNVIFYVIEALLLFRFVLVLFSANLSGPFSRWIFAYSTSLIGPFGNIFPTVNVVGFPVDFTVLFALVVYMILGQLIARVLYYFAYPLYLEA